MKFSYTVTRSKRKTIAIQVDIDCNIMVKAPYSVSDEKITAFVDSKKQWLEKTIIQQKEKKKNQPAFTDEQLTRMRQRAKQIIPPKVEYYSKIMGVTPTSVKINSAKTRYGSCSGKNSLNFSLYLMAKDERFIDYVVIHELAHIKHHNHSKEFYEFIEKFMPDYKIISKL
ncbi:MAG: M48 family metallopeptidase [Clostridia bacterium]|nr:M48 family metallopeptidase [Clostridia bacterium]